MKRKAFTLIELLVVVAIIALLVSILMPALGRAREMANRVKCGSQLNGIGKAMAIYQNDYSESNPSVFYGINPPYAGYAIGAPFYHTNPSDGAYYNWCDPAINEETNNKQYPNPGAMLWLLVKYADLVPDMFLCPSADYGVEMDLSIATTHFPTANITGWSACHDFFSAYNNCYSYNDPFNRPINASSSGAMIVMADKNRSYHNTVGTGGRPGADGGVDPFYAANPIPQDGTLPDWTEEKGSSTRKTVDPKKQSGNSPNHKGEGQNVLYADSHVKYHSIPTVGIQEDNIYSNWTVNTNPNIDTDIRDGEWGHSDGIQCGLGGLKPSSEDTYLIN